MLENIALIKNLSEKYSREGLDFLKALRAWKESNLSPESIRDQILFDARMKISSAEAHDVHKASSMITRYGFKLQDFGISDESHSDLVPDGVLSSSYKKVEKQWGGGDTIKAQDYKVSLGRSELIPDNFANRKVKFVPSVRMSVEKVDKNLYRSKTAAKYWMLKNKKGNNGKEELYLVAVNDSPEETSRKEAVYKDKIAQIVADAPQEEPVTAPQPAPAPAIPPATSQAPTTPPVQTPPATTNTSNQPPAAKAPEDKSPNEGDVKPQEEKGTEVVEDELSNISPEEASKVTNGDYADVTQPDQALAFIMDILKSGDSEKIATLQNTVGPDMFSKLNEFSKNAQNVSPFDILKTISGGQNAGGQ